MSLSAAGLHFLSIDSTSRLSSLAGNDYPTISALQTDLWTTAFAESDLVPANLGVGGAYAQITADVVAKDAAGFPPTIVDAYGRLLSYQLLKGPDIEMSTITGYDNFTSHKAPYPIITALNVETATGACIPSNNSVIYEFSPFEFGSFDAGVNAFTQTKYLGTSLSNGSPTKATCETNYDNLGMIRLVKRITVYSSYQGTSLAPLPISSMNSAPLSRLSPRPLGSSPTSVLSYHRPTR